jgi:hypothetical protein
VLLDSWLLPSAHHREWWDTTTTEQNIHNDLRQAMNGGALNDVHRALLNITYMEFCQAIQHMERRRLVNQVVEIVIQYHQTRAVMMMMTMLLSLSVFCGCSTTGHCCCFGQSSLNTRTHRASGKWHGHFSYAKESRCISSGQLCRMMINHRNIA